MKINFDSRLKALEEETAKHRVISTFVDLVVWVASDSDEEVECSPGIQKLIEETNKSLDESSN